MILCNVDVQFSSVLLAKVDYNARIHLRILSCQGSPEETRRPMKPGLLSHKEIRKVKFAESRILQIHLCCKEKTKQRLILVKNSVKRKKKVFNPGLERI